MLGMVRRWGADYVVSRGRKIFAADLPGFCAIDPDGNPLGLATYEVVGDDCQMVTLHALELHKGVGTALVEAIDDIASAAGCRRLWLITTNDNLAALRFYQRRGFELTAVHRNFRQVARRLKPSIPLVGDFGIPLRDELELEKRLEAGSGPSAVVFDMDGVLLDSSATWEAVMEDLFSEYGKSLSDLDKEAFGGGDNTQQWAAYLRRVMGFPLTEGEIINRVIGGIIADYSKHIPLIPGAVEAVVRMAARYPLGLASSSPRAVIAFVLQRSGLERLFSAWVSSDDVACGKPAPDVYLHCCDLLGASPGDCVAVEDSRFGIRAAKAAGMKVIAVPNPDLPLDSEAEALADMMLGSIDGLGPDTTESLLGEA